MNRDKTVNLQPYVRDLVDWIGQESVNAGVNEIFQFGRRIRLWYPWKKLVRYPTMIPSIRIRMPSFVLFMNMIMPLCLHWSMHRWGRYQ
jgi:hypothetical protein